MVRLQPTKQTDMSTIIYKHGSTYEEPSEHQTEYPFQLCPECFGENTLVLYCLSLSENTRCTGDIVYRRKILFEYGYECVNYKCVDCGCEFCCIYQTAEKRPVEVDPHISGYAISIPIIILCAFLFGTCIIIGGQLGDNTPWYISALFVLSIVTGSIAGEAIFASL